MAIISERLLLLSAVHQSTALPELTSADDASLTHLGQMLEPTVPHTPHLGQIDRRAHVLSRSDDDVMEADDFGQAYILAVHHPVEELQGLVSWSVGVERRYLVAFGQSLGQTILEPGGGLRNSVRSWIAQLWR